MIKTVEEKAKAYDEALEKIHQFIDGYSRREISKEELEDMFPELAESEDEMIRKALIDTIKFWGTVMESPYILGIPKEDILAWLERQAQKFAWSEEDEKAINDIMWIIEAYRENGFNETHIQMADSSEKWLKSLKERYTWKPSDEQMEALYTYIYNPQYFNSPDPRMELVESVYKDLKKLKG